MAHGDAPHGSWVRSRRRYHDHLLNSLIADQSRRSRTNRPRHLQTVVCDIRSRFATAVLSWPSAHARMIGARRARCGAVRDRWAYESSRTRSSSVRINATLRPFISHSSRSGHWTRRQA